MQNFFGPFKPQPIGNDELTVMQFVDPQTKMPLIDIEEDTGTFVEAMLKDPKKRLGITVAAADNFYSFSEIVRTLSEVSGKGVSYKQVPEAAWKGHLSEVMKDEMAEMMMLFQVYGYHGKTTEDQVESGKSDVGTTTTLADFVGRNLVSIGLA